MEPTRPKTPDFILKDLEGNSFQLSSQNGKVVLIHFFATWCSVCQAETSALNKLKNDLREKGLVVVAITVDYEDPSKVQDFVDTYDVNYTVLLDTVVRPDQGLTVSMAYDINSVPVTFVVDRDGWIDDRRYDGGMSEEDLLSVIEPLLSGSRIAMTLNSVESSLRHRREPNL